MSPPLTAQRAAAALVACARALGENAELVARGCCPNSRAGYHALEALYHHHVPLDLAPVAEQWAVAWQARDPRLEWWAGARVDVALIERVAAELGR